MKYTGKGASFQIISGGATPAWVVIGQVSAIGDIGITADEVDVTTLDAGDYRDFIQGFKDPGECELTVIHDPGLDSHKELWALFESGADVECAVRLNSSGTGGEAFLTFTAFVRDWTFNALNPDDPQQAAAVFRIKSPVSIEDTLPAPTVKETAPAKAA